MPSCWELCFDNWVKGLFSSVGWTISQSSAGTSWSIRLLPSWRGICMHLCYFTESTYNLLSVHTQTHAHRFMGHFPRLTWDKWLAALVFNKGFWYEVLRAGCPSWWQPAEAHLASHFLCPLQLTKGSMFTSFCVGWLMPVPLICFVYTKYICGWSALMVSAFYHGVGCMVKADWYVC